MYHYKGKPITVHADNDGGLWFYDDRSRVRTVKEDRVEQCEEFEILQGRAKAKKKQGHEALWFCANHRKFITEHTCVSLLYDKDCKDWEAKE